MVMETLTLMCLWDVHFELYCLHVVCEKCSLLNDQSYYLLHLFIYKELLVVCNAGLWIMHYVIMDW